MYQQQLNFHYFRNEYIYKRLTNGGKIIMEQSMEQCFSKSYLNC